MFSKFKICTNDYGNFQIDDYFDIGKKQFKQQKENLRGRLDKYVDYGHGVIDGEKLEKEWFNEIEADVFLSHSHADEKLILAIAGWLHVEMRLTAFVDSCAWGYCEDILKQINDNYNQIEPKSSGSKTYYHDKANYAASHVYLMLNSALNNMINKTECFMFVETANSTIQTENTAIKMDMTRASEQTKSPWIYSEIVMVNTMTISPPQRKQDIVKHSYSEQPLNESQNWAMTHALDFSDFNKINLCEFPDWLCECSNNEHALDTLYRLKKVRA